MKPVSGAIAAVAAAALGGTLALAAVISATGTSVNQRGALALETQLNECLASAGITEGLSEKEINSEQVRTVSTQCIGARVELLVLEEGPDAAWDAVLELTRRQPAFADCHEVAHYIAHGVARTEPPSTLMRHSRPYCSYGYLDGAVMAIGEANPQATTNEVIDMVVDSCRNYPTDRDDWEGVSNNCYHGIGHIVWERTKPNADAALGWCARLSDEPAYPEGVSPRAQCAGGAAMDISGTFVDKGQEIVPRKSTPSQYCVGLSEAEQVQCITYSFAADLETRNVNPRSYLDWCTDPSTGITAVYACFDAVGARAGFFRGIGIMLPICFEYANGEETYEDACAGAVLTGLTSTSSMDPGEAADKVCAEAPVACESARRAAGKDRKN